MEVSKVLFNPQTNMCKIGNNKSDKMKEVRENDTFQLSFKGYDRLIKIASKKVLESDSQVEKTFTDLFREVTKDDKSCRAIEYITLEKAFNKHGFRGLLYELWKSKPQDNLKKYLQNGTLDLVKKEGKPLFQIIHFDRFGFSKSSPNDVKLVFTEPKEEFSIQFGLNSKGELETWQTGNDKTLITTYHITTGNRKCLVEHPINGNSETTYYNKDGTKAFWKNLLLGGVAIVPQ